MIASGSFGRIANSTYVAGLLVPYLTVGLGLHVFQSAWLAVSFIILTAAGWLWRQVTQQMRSLLPSAFFHLTADVSILLAIVSEVT